MVLVSSCSNPDKLPEDFRSENTASETPLALSALETQAIKSISDLQSEKQTNIDLSSRVKKAMQSVLYDPMSAEYSALKKGRNGSICGKLNGKNRYGAYVGFKDFVVTGNGVAYLSSYNDGLLSDSSSYFAKAYLNFCASSDERALFDQVTDSVAKEEVTPNQETSPSEVPDEVLDAPEQTYESGEGAPTT